MAQTFRVPVEDLTIASFRPYGEVIEPRNALGQFIDKPYDPETSADEADLLLTNGKPRLWIMDLEGREWFIAVAASSDPGDAALPRLEDIRGFRISGRCVIKLEIGTWHAGPLFQHENCLFFNLENLDTNKRDFQGIDLPLECRLAV
jgi:ureidoglycolate hydrolase